MKSQEFEPLKPRQTRNFSQNIEDEFHQIETYNIQEIERLKAVERYYQMRLEEQENPGIIEQRRRKQLRHEAPQRPVQTKIYAPKQETTPKKNQEIPPEIKIEARQNIDYFCIENHSSPRWPNQEHCQEYGVKSLEQCKEQFYTQTSLDIVSCVKKKLRS